MPRSKKSSTKKKSPASAKRQKTGSQFPSPLETPYVSLLSGQDFSFDALEEETHAHIQCLPASPTAALPAHAGPFLQKAATAFSKVVHDVLLGPDDILISLTLDENKIAEYYRFCQKSPICIPDSDFSFRAKPESLDELLERYVNFEILDNYMADIGVRREFGDSSDYSMTGTSDSEASVEPEPAPAKTKGRMPLLGLKNKSPLTTRTSASCQASQTQVAAQRPASPIEMESTSEEPQPSTSTDPPTTPATTDVPATDNSAPSQVAAADKSRSRPRTRYTPIDFAKLDIVVPPPPTHLTVLFRPAEASGSLKDCNPAKLCKELLTLGPWTAQRSIRDGGIAVDFNEGTPESPILATTSLMGIPVKASLPVSTSTCTGVITGVHWELTQEEILENSTTTTICKITESKRLAKPGQKSWAVKLTFASTSLPSHVMLYGRRHPVKEYKRAPLMCFQCSRYGHAARMCKSERRCVTCGENHESKDCQNAASPTCVSCKGAHPANSTLCPTWAFQQKVTQVKAANNITYKSARQAVSKAARTYSAALKGPTTANQPKPTPATNKQQQQATQTERNIAHPRPLPEPANASTLAALFKGLVQILSAAAGSNNLAGALQQLADLFRSLAPDLDPAVFQTQA